MGGKKSEDKVQEKVIKAGGVGGALVGMLTLLGAKTTTVVLAILLGAFGAMGVTATWFVTAMGSLFLPFVVFLITLSITRKYKGTVWVSLAAGAITYIYFSVPSFANTILNRPSMSLIAAYLASTKAKPFLSLIVVFEGLTAYHLYSTGQRKALGVLLIGLAVIILGVVYGG